MTYIYFYLLLIQLQTSNFQFFNSYHQDVLVKLRIIAVLVVVVVILFRLYIAISKNVVGENDECQLSNGDCTTEKKRGY